MKRQGFFVFTNTSSAHCVLTSVHGEHRGTNENNNCTADEEDKENMKELDPDMLEKIAGGEEDDDDDDAPMNRLKRLVRQARLFGLPCEEALRLMLYSFEGELPAGETEAYVKMAYGV